MKNILKKVRVLSIVLFSIALAVSVLGCPSDSGTPTSGTTFQSQIDAATPGSTVTLNMSYSRSSITINKALTVDGNGIENLSIYVNSSVANNVTLRNFSNATITVTNSNRSARLARTAGDNSDDGDFKKLGDDDLQLKLEGCTIEKLDAFDDLALYLDNGEKKSEIDELNLKSGVEDFTFIEFDKADKLEIDGNEATPTAQKSNVGELNIEGNGVKEVNLIGGTFDDVNLATGFTGNAIDFKYDKDFADQFGEFGDKTAFFNNSKIAEKDVAVAEKSGNSNVYSFTMSRDYFNAMNGFLTIVFMTSAQKQWMDNHNGNVSEADSSNLDLILSCATTQNPIYMMIPAGAFTVNNPDQATGLKTIYGGEYAYVDYAHYYAKGITTGYERDDVVVLDKYRNYNKEAIIADCGNSNTSDVTIYVNTAAIRKEDVVLCNGEHVANQEAKTEAGTKISEMSLDGYVPYLAVDYTSAPNGNGGMDGVFSRLNMLENGDAQENFINAFGTKYCSMSSAIAIYGSAIKLGHEMNLVLYEMATENVTYPTDASSATYSSIMTPSSKDNHGLITQFDNP